MIELKDVSIELKKAISGNLKVEDSSNIPLLQALMKEADEVC